MSNENRKKSYRLHGKTSKRAVPSALQGVSVAIFFYFQMREDLEFFQSQSGNKNIRFLSYLGKQIFSKNICFYNAMKIPKKCQMKTEKKATDCMRRLLKERSRRPYREFLLLFFLPSNEGRSRNYSKTNGNKPCQIAVISFQMRLFSLFSIRYFITTNSIYISYTKVLNQK